MAGAQVSHNPLFGTPTSASGSRVCPGAPSIARTLLPTMGDSRPKVSSPLSMSRTARELDDEPVSFVWDAFPAAIPASPPPRRINRSVVVAGKTIPTVPDFGRFSHSEE